MAKGYDLATADKWAAARVRPKKVDGSAMAQSWSQQEAKGIAVNAKYGGDVAEFERVLAKSATTKWHPIGCDTIRSVADHEMGHQLDDLLRLDVDNEVKNLYNEAKKLGMKDEVSGYAATNIKEFIAECWSESCNNQSPRKFAKEIATIVRARYGARAKP